MSTAQHIIERSLRSIGLGTKHQDFKQSLLDDCLPILISCLETLRKRGIILEETVSGTTTTITVPSALSDELDEPAAAYSHLINYVAPHLVALAQADPQDALRVPPLKYSEDALFDMYYQDDIPNKVPSKLLPRGQGGDRGLSVDPFFRGEALDDDAD